MINKSLLTFEEKDHIYKYDGQVIQSVTQVLNSISQEIYKGINPSVMQVAADRGSKIHFAIELYSEYGVIEIDEEHKEYLNAYIQFQKDFTHKVIHNEYRVYSELYGYAGTLDNLGIVKLPTGAVIQIVIDYKNVAKLHKKLVALQLSAYRQALKEEGIIVNQAGVLQLKPNGKHKFILFTEEELDKHFENFKEELKYREDGIKHRKRVEYYTN